MTIAKGNRLREIREREGIETRALATASRVNERMIRRIEVINGSPRLEIKAQLVAGLNSLIGSKRYQTDEVFVDWQPHRRRRRHEPKQAA